MALSMEYRKEMSNKYRRLDCLLLYLDDYPKTDLEIIKEFVYNFNSEYLKETLSQIEEVLKLEPIPIEWIEDMMRSRPLREREWLEWLAQTLEEEAKKAGKL